jgi:class 3 adenylate cyclase/tetratricopeptide (TPR) repeat protein
MSTCPSCGHENQPQSRFCSACGLALDAEQAVREVRKTVTVVFSDVTGSTALGERLDPESLRRVLARYFEEARRVVERHGGTVEKFIGDAVMAVFGVPRVHEDDALRAVRAAWELREVLEHLNEELERDFGTRLELRIGVNTGEVVTGTKERLATGDAVNVAARLEQAAAPGEILLGAETLRLVRDAVETEPLEARELKGKREPLVPHRIVALREEEPGDTCRLDAPLVGRERELRRLRDAYDQAARDRSCQLFTLLGVAGVGKSRLTAEFLDSLEDGTVVRGRCLPYGEGITYWPVVEVLRQLRPSGTVGLEAAAAGAIEALFGEEQIAASSEEIARGVRKLLEAAAQPSPLVVLFDDIHWGEPTFLDLVEHIADLSRESPILLLCLARPELLDRRPTWGGGKLNATTVLLEPLSAGETEELLERLLGEAAPAREVRARIQEAAEGNPLFVEEMVALLEESGDGEVSVPPTIQALLAARLDQLDPSERGVLERGSVEGRVFHRGAVQALAPEERELAAQLTALVRKELVRPDKAQLPGEDAFRFRHLLIRDAAYDALPKSARAQLHEQFAEWLGQHGTELVELDEIIGHHLEQCYRYRAELGPVGPGEEDVGRRAAAHLATAGRRSLTMGDGHGAANLLDRALSLVEPGDAESVELLLDLASALVDSGDLRRARARFEEAVAVAEALHDRALQIRATVMFAQLRLSTDSSFTAQQGLELGHASVRELESLGHEQGLVAAWNLLQMGENLRANWQGNAAALERVVEHAHAVGDLRREAEALRGLSASIFWGPTPISSGLPRLEGMLERAGADTWLGAMLARAIAGFHGMQGRFDEARALLARSRSILEELGATLDLMTMAFFTGPLELLAGEPKAAVRELRSACDALEERGEKGWLSTLSGMLGWGLCDEGRLAEAATAASRGREVATSDDHDAHAFWRSAEARVLARRGKHEEAERLAREAVARIDRTDELDNRALMRTALAEVLELAERRADAASVVEDALRLYEQKGNVVRASRSRAWLEEAGPSAVGPSSIQRP